MACQKRLQFTFIANFVEEIYSTMLDELGKSTRSQEGINTVSTKNQQGVKKD